MNSVNFQDWEPVVLKNSKSKAQKQNNTPNQAGHKEYIKLLEDDIPTLNKITREYAQAIVDGRKALNITQKELAQKMCIKDNIIKEYENCSVVNFNLQFYKRILKALNIDPKTICKK
jgi:ribosome-binding protein aMBF1 (putative translation factor)